LAGAALLTPHLDAHAQEGRYVLEVNGPVVARLLVIPLSQATGKRWPPVAKEIQRALDDPPESLAYWVALGEELRNQSRKDMVHRLESELDALPYTPEEVNEYIGPITLASRDFKGDCEDFAALGLMVLAVAGVPEEEALVAVGTDRQGRAHAVIGLKNGDEWLVADFADPGARPAAEAGFEPVAFGFVNHVAVKVSK
jgi:transglutaminase-like putative cysteine protease